MFHKYMHLERYGNEEVDGIERGTTYVFPKLDGTNAQVWLGEDGNICAGSRNRNLSLDNDNAGFMNYIITDSRIKWLLAGFPELRLYGEWLVPHSLKTYRDDAWRKFYIFDVYNVETGEIYHYDRYKEILGPYDLDYLEPIAIVKNGTRELYEKCLDRNVFLIKDGMGVGEGIVIKNYEWQNKFGRTVWAKMVTNNFKEIHHKGMGAPVIGGETLEEKIVAEYVDEHLINKVVAKISNDEGGWTSKFIPRLLQTVFYDLVNEELWNIIKKHKNPKIDFAYLQLLTITKVKQERKDIFNG